MSGHSKWSKVKHQKAVTDVVKGAAFTKAARVITIAVLEGGGVTDPAMNFHLRLAIEKARDVNVPKENIARAIERAKGNGEEMLEQVRYEAYGPGGTAIIIEGATNNRQRTVSHVKNTIERAGGRLAEPGSVLYLFRRQGVLIVNKRQNQSKDEIEAAAIECGVDDVIEKDDVYELYTEGSRLSTATDALKILGVEPQTADFILRPIQPMILGDQASTTLERLASELEALDDVSHVYTNTA